ncbi:hypothetical protein TNCV_2179031 [Trichonephila clavipes]|uniref:Uncharacterized protein n=1 Tax=Trichonephila clavipes TaxID=2585209 RepID=A0A8X6VUB1_TRICX|nr:hypothetical protein TNCV_2179031 [Trichonephila clavipes]
MSMVCIGLTERLRAVQRNWAAEHQDWIQSDWSQVLFTDKSRISSECERDTPNNPIFIQEISNNIRGHVVDIYELVCAGDCTCGDSDLELCRFAFWHLDGEHHVVLLELSCNLIVKKFDNLKVLARLHLGAVKELKWSHLDASLKS